MRNAVFFRLLHHEDKGEALRERISALHEGNALEDVFSVNPDLFRQVPNTSFCYWVSERVRRLFKELPPFESDGRTVKQGLVTADDFRFLRAWWEVPAESILDSMRYAEVGCQEDNEEKWSEERIRVFQAWCRNRTYEGKRWVPFAKGGEYSPFYADIHLVVNWERDGAEIRNFIDPQTGKINSRPQNTDFYFRPGLTYTSYTNLGFAPRVLPAGSVFSVAGMGIHGVKKCLLVFLNSTVVQCFLYQIADRRKWEAGVIQRLPVPNLSDYIPELNLLSDQAWPLKRSFDLMNDTTHAFTLPTLLQCPGMTLGWQTAACQKQFADGEAELSKIQSEADEIAFNLYGFTTEERKAVSSSQYSVGCENRRNSDEYLSDEEDIHIKEEETASPANSPLHTANLLSWGVGVAFGRSDVRIAINPSLAPKLPDPFDPLPVCPPGMLVGPNGLPAEPEGIVSEEWLRARENANMLPEEGSVENPVISDFEYPIRISWSGIIVDDEGHKEDIISKIREVIAVLWQNNNEEIEQEICEILDISDLREFFRRPSGFFHEHLRRYSKSRRSAPIYWPISTPSGSYTIWLYYHKLSDQTLYMCVNDFIDPKIKQLCDDINRLRIKERRTSVEEGELEKLRDLELELKDFRNELLSVAAFWRPDLNDGVQITAAPLWKFFRHRQWQTKLKETWEKLEAGDYDWAHLALSIWPERVVRASHKDLSLAIAHGLVEDLWSELSIEKKGRNKGARSELRPRKLSEEELNRIVQTKK